MSNEHPGDEHQPDDTNSENAKPSPTSDNVHEPTLPYLPTEPNSSKPGSQPPGSQPPGSQPNGSQSEAAPAPPPPVYQPGQPVPKYGYDGSVLPQNSTAPIPGQGPVPGPPPGGYPPGYYPPGQIPPGYPPNPNAAPPRDRGPMGPNGNRILTIISWIGILLFSQALFLFIAYSQLSQSEASTKISAAELMQVEMQGRMFVGQQALFENTPGGQLDSKQLNTINTGTPEQRLCHAILLNEFEDADEAYKAIDDLKDRMRAEDFEPSDEQARLMEILQKLFDRYSVGDFDWTISIEPDEKEFLQDELGWFGKLAVFPPQATTSDGRMELVSDAKTSLLVLFGIGILLILAVLAGMALLVAFVILTSTRKIKSRLRLPAGRGGIYAETFAIWLIGFMGIQIGVSLLESSLDPTVATFAIPAIFFASLGVLVWPIIRGVPFKIMLKDIGWKFGNPFVEIPMGALAYLALMPLVGVSFIFMFVIMMVMAMFQPESLSEFSSMGGGGHPIQDQIAGGSIEVLVAVFLTACVAAPIVEETMFRGVLYRHLRDSTHGARVASILISCIVNGFIFASIHPQGLMGIPMLTTLAIGFSLAREWRDSLVASITMHAINNAIVTCMMISLL